MLPVAVTQNLPVVGLLLLVLALVFEVISAVMYPDIKSLDMEKTGKKVENLLRFHNLALICAVCGVALMCSSH